MKALRLNYACLTFQFRNWSEQSAFSENMPAIASYEHLGGHTFAPEKMPICDEVSKIDILRATSTNKPSVICGKLWKDRSLSYWIWPNYENRKFDAELVFWADEFFGGSMGDAEKINSFGTVHGIAEEFRENSPDCVCVLSSHETGDPREGRGESHTIFW